MNIICLIIFYYLPHTKRASIPSSTIIQRLDVRKKFRHLSEAWARNMLLYGQNAIFAETEL